MHWQEWLASGVFFALIAVFQTIWAFVAWSRPTALALAAGVAVNAGSAALWVLTRIAGAPFGPHAGQPEAVDAAGICVLLLQCYVVMGAGWTWLRGYRTEQVSGFGRGLVLLGASTVMAAAVSVGLASSLQGHGHHGGATEAEGGHPATHDGHMDGHHDPKPLAPPDEAGRPVTDMRLETGGHPHDDAPAPDGDHHHNE